MTTSPILLLDQHTRKLPLIINEEVVRILNEHEDIRRVKMTLDKGQKPRLDIELEEPVDNHPASTLLSTLFASIPLVALEYAYAPQDRIVCSWTPKTSA